MQVPTKVEASVDANVKKCVAKAQWTQKANFGGQKRQGFSVGSMVIAKDYSVAGKVSWTKAKVVQILGSQVYLIETMERKTWKRHANQLISCSAKMPAENNDEIYTPTTLLDTQKSQQEPSPPTEDSLATDDKDQQANEDVSDSCSRYNLRPRK